MLEISALPIRPGCLTASAAFLFPVQSAPLSPLFCIHHTKGDQGGIPGMWGPVNSSFRTSLQWWNMIFLHSEASEGWHYREKSWLTGQGRTSWLASASLPGVHGASHPGARCWEEGSCRVGEWDIIIVLERAQAPWIDTHLPCWRRCSRSTVTFISPLPGHRANTHHGKRLLWLKLKGTVVCRGMAHAASTSRRPGLFCLPAPM